MVFVTEQFDAGFPPATAANRSSLLFTCKNGNIIRTKLKAYKLLNGHRTTSLTLGRGAVARLLGADFPVLAVSDLPRSPLTLLADGRADFFMLSLLMATHLKPDLQKKMKEGGEKHARVER